MPDAVITSIRLAKAIFNTGLYGANQTILENIDIRMLEIGGLLVSNEAWHRKHPIIGPPRSNRAFVSVLQTLPKYLLNKCTPKPLPTRTNRPLTEWPMA
jgi:hypothetical protein